MHYHELSERDRQDVDEYFAGATSWELLTPPARQYVSAGAYAGLTDDEEY